MKILMGAVIVLSMAAVTACGKKPEVVEEKTVESVHEEPEMADEQMTGSEHEETTESVDEEIAEITDRALKEWQISLPGMVHIIAKTENISRCMIRMRIICFFLARRVTTSR